MTFLGSSARRWQGTTLVGLGLFLMGGCGGSDKTPTTPGGGPPVTITPGIHAFAPTATNAESAPQIFTIRNDASATLLKTAVSLTGTTPGDFKLENKDCGQTLGSKASCTVVVTFTPKTPGEKSASLKFDANSLSKVVTVTGTATQPPALSIDPSDSNFGGVLAGTQSAPKAFSITNDGTVATPDKPTLAISGEFVLVDHNCNGPIPGKGSCTANVLFSPSSEGPKNGTLTASLGAAFMATSALRGQGTVMPRLEAMPASLDFPDTIVGKSAPDQLVTVRNPSATPLTMVTTGASPNDFTITVAKCDGNVVPAMGTCTFNVRFSPKATGPAKGTANIGVMGAVGAQLPLAGRGLRPALLVLTPSTLTFPSTSVGSSSAAIPLTLRNDGQENATSIAATVTGMSKDDYVLTNNCGTFLNPESSCTLSVVFSPKAQGASNATLSVTSTAGGQQSATLAGTGVPPATITITPNSHEFGMVAVDAASGPQVFAVKNTGGTTSGKLTVSIQGNEFRLASELSNACKDRTLAPNETCELSVIFAPTSAGAKTSTLNIASEGAGSTGASLRGTALAPPQLAIGPASGNFGSVGTGGQSSELTFTVSNVGGGTTGVVTVMPNSPQYTISSNGCVSKMLAVNESCTVGVRLTPTAVGDFPAKLVATASPGGSFGADLLGAGTAPPTLVFRDGSGVRTVVPFGPFSIGEMSGPETVFLQNTGTMATGMLATTIGGDNPGDFSIVTGSNNCVAPLPAGGQCSIQLIFKPTAAGSRSAVLNVTSATGGVGTILLTGSGTALLQIRRGMVAVTTPQSFGELTAGNVSAAVKFTVFAASASGTYTVDTTALGPNFAVSASTCTGAPLAANGSCDIDIVFQPQYPRGAKTGTLTVTTSAGVSATLSLAGTAVGPLQATPSPHNFGSVAVGTTAEQVFTLRNNGPQAMNSVAVTIAGDDFTVVEDQCAVAPAGAGSLCTIKVRFVPTSAGAKTATLTAVGSYIVAGATETDTATVAISGNATGAAAISVTGEATFGEVPVGATPVTRTFTVRNAAAVPASGPVLRTISAGDFTLTRNGCVLANNTTPKPLAAGDMCTFDVLFTPSATGTRTGTLTVAANPGGTINVALTGNGTTSLAISHTVPCPDGNVACSVDLDKNNAGDPVENVLAQVNGKRRVIVTNRSAASLAISASLVVSSELGATADGPTYFNLTPDSTTGATACGASLAAGASCSYEIQMVTPTAGTAGTKRAVFRATGGTATSTVTREIVGTLLRDAVIEFLDGANRDFGGVVVGMTSGSHTIQLKNTGGVKTGAVQMFDLIDGFARSPMTGTNTTTGNKICTLGQTLAVNETCDILVQFAPTSAGAKSSTLRVYVTGAGSATGGTFTTPNVRTLSGVGLAAQSLVLTPTPVDFGAAAAGTATAVDRTVTVTNSTGGTVNIGAGDITLSGGAAGFSIVPGSSCIGAIAGGVQCTVTLRFQPAGGAAQGTVFDTLNVSTSKAALLGTVARAPALTIVAPTEGADWGEALVGTAAPKRTFTVRNTGDAPTGSAPAVAIAGTNASEFAVLTADNGCTAVLAAGASCTVAITLTPSAIGPRTATIAATATGTTAATAVDLAANGVLPNAVQIVSIAGTAGTATVVSFGNKAVGSESAVDVVVRNAANAQRIVTPTFALTDAVSFRFDTNPGVANDCSDEIADGGGLEGGESCTVRVYFRPQALPPATVAAPNLTSKLTVGGAVTPLEVTLQGNAISALSISPASGAFASTAVNATSAVVSFTVTNSSDANIGPTGQLAISKAGTDAAAFRIVADGCTGNTLAPGGTCMVNLVFEPKTTGSKTGTLTVAAPSTNGATAALTGTGT